MLKPIRPTVGEGAGRPLSNWSQLSPPSVDLKIPLVIPPAMRAPGVRIRSHIAAYTADGLSGSITTSIAEVESEMNSTCVQLCPPSLLR